MSQYALLYADQPSAISALAAAGIAARSMDGTAYIPQVGFINGVRYDCAVTPVASGLHIDLLTDAELTFDPTHVASGGAQTAFTPVPTPVVVPTTVPMWAAQAALKAAGKYDAINTAILAMETNNPPVFFAWTMGNYADRNSAFIGALAASFGMASADIDALFIAADKIANAAG